MKPMIMGAMLALLGNTAFAQDEGRWTTPTMIEARANMFSAALNYLTNQHMDQLFATRDVAAGGDVWTLDEALVDLTGDYDIAGESRTLEGALEYLDTNALVVLKDGKLVFERYRNGSDASTRFLTFSVAKSYVATLIGLAVEKGLIKNISDPVTDYMPELADTGYDGTSVEDVLRMRSGVNWAEIYEFGSDTQLTQVHDNSLVAYKYRWCDYAIDQSEKGDNAAGEVFNYATLDTSVLGCILERVTGTTGAAFMSENLWGPMGAEADAYWIMDGPEDVGREFFGAGLAATARDHARFGQLILQGGKRGDTQIVPADWVTAMTTSDGQYDDTGEGSPFGYGLQWWTMMGSVSFAALGLHHQYIYVDPENDIVIVKASYTPEPVGRDGEMLALFDQITERLVE